jgi:NTP pyrophosphatase (non-canonical NTP hydrolase)
MPLWLKDEGNIEDAFTLIRSENREQLKKWGYQNHSIFEWVTYLTEEVGELAKAVSEREYRDGKTHCIIDEAIQVATLASKIAVMCMIAEEKKNLSGHDAG